MSNCRLLLGWLVIPLAVLAASDCDAHDTSRSATKKPPFQGIVLEGQLELQRAQEKLVAGPGTTAVLPRGIPHAFRNIGSGPSRVLVVMSPGRFLKFFEEIDALSRQREVTPADASRIGAGYKLTIHPPPAKQ